MNSYFRMPLVGFCVGFLLGSLVIVLHSALVSFPATRDALQRLGWMWKSQFVIALFVAIFNISMLKIGVIAKKGFCVVLLVYGSPIIWMYVLLRMA